MGLYPFSAPVDSHARTPGALVTANIISMSKNDLKHPCRRFKT